MDFKNTIKYQEYNKHPWFYHPELTIVNLVTFAYLSFFKGIKHNS